MAYWQPEGYHQMGLGKYFGISAEDVLERMKEATGTQSMLELANLLDARQSWLSDAKRRNIIPVAWLRALVLKKSDYNTVWVMTDQGEKLWEEYRLTWAGVRSMLPEASHGSGNMAEDKKAALTLS